MKLDSQPISQIFIFHVDTLTEGVTNLRLESTLATEDTSLPLEPKNAGASRSRKQPANRFSHAVFRKKWHPAKT